MDACGVYTKPGTRFCHLKTRRPNGGPSESISTMRMLKPFFAGALAVVVFHQGALAALHALGVTDRVPFVVTPTAPFGVPLLVSAAFWGGVWGTLLWPLVPRLGDRIGYWTAAVALGAIAPSVVAWFVVAPLKGQPMAGGQPTALLTPSS